MRRDVHFKSSADTCAGWFFIPPGEGPFPAVAMAHGLGAVKEMYLAPFAEAFAAAGVAALLFDYRGYGDSGGMLSAYRPSLSDMSWRDVSDSVDDGSNKRQRTAGK